MRFEVEITHRGMPASPLRPHRSVGVMIDGQARFGGERVSVDWDTARSLIARGQAKAAPGVVVPLTSPERRP